MRFMTRGDKILVVLLVVASLFSFWLVKEINSKIDSRYISIQVNGRNMSACVLRRRMNRSTMS